MQLPHPSKILGPFALAMMAIVAIIDLRGVPIMASYGLSALFLYAIAAVCFLIPSALICTELSTAFPEAGGLYAWISKAFGPQTGFFAMWLEWINNVVSFPAMLTFIVVTLTYIFNPHLATHKYFIFGSTLLILWLVTLFTSLGVKASSRLNIIGALLGTIFPALLIIILSMAWLFSKHTLQIHFAWHALLPVFHFDNLAFFSGTLLGYAGMQVIAFHALNVRHPARDYPRGIWAAVIIILIVTAGTSLAVAVVVPAQKLDLVSGLIEGFNYFFVAFHMSWATPIIAALIVLSVLASLNTWFLGPARGLVVAAQKGYFFQPFAYVNRHEAPVLILILQAIIATLFLAIFFYMPTITSGFWVLLDLSAQSTLIMYGLLFACAIRLRYKTLPRAPQAYFIPGGKSLLWLVGGLGIACCAIAWLMSFTPPHILNTGSVWHYEAVLIISNLIFLSIPFVIMLYRSHSSAVIGKLK